jgi:peptidoglycan/LPS O-acetylase OafA/YrhL
MPGVEGRYSPPCDGPRARAPVGGPTPQAIPFQDRLLSLDVVRGVAILLVLGRHMPLVVRVHPFIDSCATFVNQIGWVGVDLFFVLSGFLVGGLLFREYQRSGTIDCKRFWIRRAFKIWPPYVAFILLYAICYYRYGPKDASSPVRLDLLLSDLWPNVFHVQNYFERSRQLLWTWSLAVEEHFYLLLPLVLAVLVRHRLLGRSKKPAAALILMLAVVTLGLVVRWLTLIHFRRLQSPGSDSYALRYPTHLCMDSLASGVLLAYLVRFHSSAVERLRPLRHVIISTSVIVFLLPGLFDQGTDLFLYPIGNTLMFCAAMGFVLFAYFASTAPARITMAGKRLPRRILAWVAKGIGLIGYCSYSIYLFHGYFGPAISSRTARLFGMAPESQGITSLLYLCLYVVTCILIGACVLVLIEVPALRLRNRLFPSRAC